MLSVVIPAFDAGSTLAGCLSSLYGADEIVVVDGGSTDDSRAIAEAAGVLLIAAPKGGASSFALEPRPPKATGSFFLHADTLLESGWEDGVADHIARQPDKAACFRFRLDSPAWQARLIERGVSLRVLFLGLPYGDQGLLISRRLYDAIGGYKPLLLMEDVDLVRRIGASRLALLDAEAVTSADRWRRGGWFRRSARNLACLALYGCGVAPERLARVYA